MSALEKLDAPGPQDQDLYPIDSKNLPARPANDEDKAADLADKAEKRWQRRTLFCIGLVTSITYLGFLITCIDRYLSSDKITILEQGGGWKALIAVDAVFILMAFIPMSIFWGLMKMSSVQAASSEADKVEGTALAKSIYDACSSIKDVIVSIKDAVKK